METFQNHIDGYPPTFSLYRKSLCDANSSTNLVLNLSISFHLDLSALLNACHMPLLWCPYIGQIAPFYGSITCATVEKTKFLTRHLRLGS